MNGQYTYPGGRVRGKECRLEYLIMTAFDVQRFQIVGCPAWIDLVSGESFDIEAKPPENSASARSNPYSPKSAPNNEQREMLQSMLVDRFGLKFHREAKEGPICILSKRSGQLMPTPSKDETSFPWVGGISAGWFGGGMRGENISTARLMWRLSRFLNRPVLNRTDFDGSFDFEYQMGGEDNDADIPAFCSRRRRESD
jgi:uncharacterized protein (TIGR03435 family)